MNGIDHARRLIALALLDFQAMTNMLEPSMFSDSIFGFHAQQAVEKTLKAWMCLNNQAYQGKHDLRLLLAQLEKYGASSIERFKDLADLTDFAVEYRYEIYNEEPVDRTELIGKVSALIAHVNGQLDQK
ncbi:MAG: HEPN domain-containing protein [Nitrospinae bacterium]|nr:HEPN domain-containing protein [Nitrospinota bacterium]